MKQDIVVVFMVGGISSRFGGRIKSLISVGSHGERLLEWSMIQALPAGFTKIVLIVSPMTAESIRAVFGNAFQGVPIVYAIQSFDQTTRDKPWGTTDALCSARPFLDCPFVVCNGDDIYGSTAFSVLAHHLRTHQEAAIIGYRLGDVISEVPNNRAILEVDSEENVQKIVETFGITQENLKTLQLREQAYCSMNIVALSHSVLSLLSARLEMFKAEHVGECKSECLLPNEISTLLENKVFTMKLYPAQEPWIGVTAPEDEVKVREFLKKF